MYRHARDLEFEEAANLRDEIRALQAAELEIPPAAIQERRQWKHG